MEACTVKKKKNTKPCAFLFQVFHAVERGITLTLVPTITNDIRSQLAELNASYYLQSIHQNYS